MTRPDNPRRGGFTLVFRLIGRRLRDMRTRAELSQESVAGTLGVSPQTLRNWESGRHEPSAFHLQQLAELYGSSVDELLEGPWTVREEDEIATAEASVRGYLLAGYGERPTTFQSGRVILPDFILKEYPNVFGLVVSGESLRPHGLHSGDLVLVDPEEGLEEGSVQILMIGPDEVPFLVQLTQTGAVELVQYGQRSEAETSEGVRILGRAVWLIRKIE